MQGSWDMVLGKVIELATFHVPSSSEHWTVPKMCGTFLEPAEVTFGTGGPPNAFEMVTIPGGSGIMISENADMVLRELFGGLKHDMLVNFLD